MGTPRSWVRVGRAILLTSALVISPLAATPALAADPDPATTADPGKAAAGWLAAQVRAGGLSPSNLADAVIAFAAAGVGADAAATALTQLESKVGSYILSGTPATLQPGALGKVMLAVATGGGNVKAFGGHDLEADLRSLMAASGANAGQFGSATVYDQSFAILALATTTGGVPADAGAWLASKQCADGDYSWDGSCPSWSPDPDSTAIAIQALDAAGQSAALAKADTWLVAQQAADGSLSSFGMPNSSSTAAAGQAYRVLGHGAAADKAAAWTATVQFGCDAAAANVAAIPWAAGGTDFLLMSTPQAILGFGAGRLDTLTISGAAAGAPTLACPAAPTAVTAKAGAGEATVSWTASAAGASPITSYVVVASTGSGTCAPKPATATSCTVRDLADGRYTFSVIAMNALGVSKTSQPSNRVTVDTTAPAVTSPVVGFRVGRQLSGASVPVKVAWFGSDSGTGIGAYTLERSADGGTTYAGVSLRSPTATSKLTTLAAGTASHRFRVKATDASGNTSAWKAGPALAVSLVDDATARVTYRGTWTTSKPASASAMTLHSTKSRGASAAITFTGRGIAWVAPEGSRRGKAAVYLDGRKVATVDLRDTAAARVLVYAKSFASSGKHTLRIVASGTAGRPRIDVDAFVIVK